MSKRVLFIMAMVMLLVTQFCLAKPVGDIPKEDIAIGGISFGSTMEYVRSIYGEPDEIYRKNGKEYEPQSLIQWVYGDSFSITFDANDNRAYQIKSTGRNGLEIPIGVAVGGNIFTVSNYYGEDNSYFVCDDKEYTLRLRSNNIYMMIKASRDAEITSIYIYPAI